jgi:hypothetical protein
MPDKALSPEDICDMLTKIAETKEPAKLEINYDGKDSFNMYITKISIQAFKKLF